MTIALAPRRRCGRTESTAHGDCPSAPSDFWRLRGDPGGPAGGSGITRPTRDDRGVDDSPFVEEHFTGERPSQPGGGCDRIRPPTPPNPPKARRLLRRRVPAGRLARPDYLRVVLDTLRDGTQSRPCGSCALAVASVPRRAGERRRLDLDHGAARRPQPGRGERRGRARGNCTRGASCRRAAACVHLSHRTC